MSEMEAIGSPAGGADKARKERESIMRKLARPPISAQWAQNEAVMREVVTALSEKQLRDVSGIIGRGHGILDRQRALELEHSFSRSLALHLGPIGSEVSDEEFGNFRQLLIDQEIWLSIPPAERGEPKKTGDDEMILPTVLERYRVPIGPIVEVQKLPSLFPTVPRKENLNQTKHWEDAQIDQLMNGFQIIYEFQQLPIIIDTFGPREDAPRRAFRERLERENPEACAVYESNVLRIAKMSGVFSGVESLYMAMGRLTEYKERSEEAFKELDDKIAKVRKLWKTEEIPVEEKLTYLTSSFFPYLLRVWNEVYEAFSKEHEQRAQKVA